ncbi:MAG: pilus assembly protein PilZ [Candidatus Thiodiazotropha sp.]
MAGGPKQGILSLTIKDKNALYAAYMQFVKFGGLFIPTTKQYRLGDEVSGIGVQFSDQDGGAARNKIETYLAGALKSDRPTHTM